MRTSLILPDDILKEAMTLSNARTKTEAVIISLETFVRLKLRENLARSGGKLKSIFSGREAAKLRRKR